MWEFISRHWSAELVVFILVLMIFGLVFLNMILQFILQLRFGPMYKCVADPTTSDKCSGKSKCTGKCVDKFADAGDKGTVK